MSSSKALIDRAIHKIKRRTRIIPVGKNTNLPVADVGYSQKHMLSQYRNGHSCVYRALHTLNILHGRPVSWPEVADLLAKAPKAGGWAFFIKRRTVKDYLHRNELGLWRKLDRTQLANGRRRSLFVATGLTTTGQKRADRSRNRSTKLQAVLVW